MTETLVHIDLGSRRGLRFCLIRVFAWRPLNPLSKWVRLALIRRMTGVGSLHVGGGVDLEASHPELPRTLALGVDVEIGSHVLLDVCGGLTIESGVTVSERALIYTHNHNVNDATSHWRDQGLTAYPVTLGRDSWVGGGAIVLGQSVLIGCGGIVAAGAIVTKEVAPLAVVAGNPARKIFTRGT